jgi:hypothetical protein
MRRFRSATLGSGNQTIKFKYESMYGGGVDPSKSETSPSPAASAEPPRYVDFSSFFSSSESNSNGNQPQRRTSFEGQRKPLNSSSNSVSRQNNTNNGSSNNVGNSGSANGGKRDPLTRSSGGPAGANANLGDSRDSLNRSHEDGKSGRDWDRDRDQRDRERDRERDRDRDRERNRDRDRDRDSERRRDTPGKVFDYRSSSDDLDPPRNSAAKFDPGSGQLVIPDNIFTSLQASLQGIQHPSANSRSQTAPPPPVPVKKPKREVSDDMRRDFRSGVAEVVVKRLTRYFKDGKLDKEDFKHFSRKLTHKILDKEQEKGGSHVMNDKKSQKISAFVDDYYKKKIDKHRRQKATSNSKADGAADGAPSPKRPKLE